MDDKTTLRGLKNIGPTIADRLESVDLKTSPCVSIVVASKFLVFNFIEEWQC